MKQPNLNFCEINHPDNETEILKCYCESTTYYDNILKD